MCQPRKNADFCSFCFPFVMDLQHWITWAHLGWHRLHIHMAHSPRLCVMKAKRAHCTGKHKTPLERAPIFVLQLFVWSGEKLWKGGKSNPTFLCKGTLHAESSTGSFHHITGHSSCARCSPGSQRDPGEGEGSSGDTSQQAGTAAGARGCWDRTEATLASLVCSAVTFPDFFKPNYKHSVHNTQRREEGRKIKPHQRNPIQTGCKNETNLKTVTYNRISF